MWIAQWIKDRSSCCRQSSTHHQNLEIIKKLLKDKRKDRENKYGTEVAELKQRPGNLSGAKGSPTIAIAEQGVDKAEEIWPRKRWWQMPHHDLAPRVRLRLLVPLHLPLSLLPFPAQRVSQEAARLGPTSYRSPSKRRVPQGWVTDDCGNGQFTRYPIN